MNKKTTLQRVAAVLIMVMTISSFAGIAPVRAAYASTTYSKTVTYSNPLGSGSATFTYEDGAVLYSNSKISAYKLTQTDVAAVTSETDLEITQWFDQYGTLWIIYRNEGLYWYNYEICKKGKLQKWSGESDSQNIKATRLCYKSESGSMSYVGFSYANYYTSGVDLLDYPLPNWYVLYKIFNGEDYEDVQPTTAPTTEPTVAPTTEPTQAPTTEPTTEPTQAPTQAPTTEPKSDDGCNCMNGGTCSCTEGNCNCGDGCTCSHCKGKTSTEPTQAPIQDEDTTVSGDGNSVTNNQNISVVITNTENNISVTGDGNSVNAGASVGAAASSGSGENVAAVATATPKAATTTKTTTTTKSSKKTKTYWYATRHGNRVKLWKATKNLKTGKITRKLKSVCLFSEKKQRMDLNSYKRKHVKKCQYTNKSHWVVVIDTQNKDAYLYPTGEGNKKPKRIKGTFTGIKCNSRGLAYALVTRSGKLKKLPR